MTAIERNPDAAASEQFDLVVIGGGIYGVCLLLEAARRGVRTLLIERDDFGGATSLNSLRIIHGGLRYLQRLDLSRFRRSVAEQTWWMTHFPDLVRPLPCLMPLYGRGFKRSFVVQQALRVNDALAQPIRRRIAPQLEWNPGTLLSVDQVRATFPLGDAAGLEGGAQWFDAQMVSPQRMIVETLRWAVAAGGTAINYLPCTGLRWNNANVTGVRAQCSLTGQQYEFRAEQVVNCAGPWVQDAVDSHSNAYQRRAIAFNVLLDRPHWSTHAVALTPPERGAATFFSVPCRGKLFVGTVHLKPRREDVVSEAEVAEFLRQLNVCVPELRATVEDVVCVTAGRQPPITADSPTPAKSPRIEVRGNLTTVEGVKYTTARHVAEQTLRRIYRNSRHDLPTYSATPRPDPLRSADLHPNQLTAPDLQNWMNDESVVHIDDLLIRRWDSLGEDDVTLRQLGRELMTSMGWDESLIQQETNRLEPCWKNKTSMSL